MQQMRYRGFDIVPTPADVPYHNGTTFEQCDGYYCAIYADTDPDQIHLLDHFALAVGHDIKSMYDDDLFEGVRNHIDSVMSSLQEMRMYVDSERSQELAGKLIAHLGEYENPESLYNTLRYTVGMTDYEIAKRGGKHLAPFFDKDEYAKSISDYLIRTSTENTLTGNWLTGFDEIENEFGVNLAEDTELLDKVCDHLSMSGEILCDLQAQDEQFDLTFYTDYCPYAEMRDAMNDMSTM